MAATDTLTLDLLASISKILRYAELDAQQRNSEVPGADRPLQEQLVEEIDNLERSEIIRIVSALQQVSDIMDRKCQNPKKLDGDAFDHKTTPPYLSLNPLD